MSRCKELLSNLWSSSLGILNNQKFKFLLVGALNTVIGFMWFVAFELLVGSSAGYIVSLILAHVFSVFSSFLLNRYLVFKVRGLFFRDLIRFEMVQLGLLATNLVCLPLLVEVFQLVPIVAQGIITILTVLLSWFGYKYFSFRRK